MRRAGTGTSELVMPARALAALRRSLTESVGPDATADALRRAGHEAGDAFFELLEAGMEAVPERSEGPGPVAGLPEPAFWERMAAVFAARGWGRLAHDAVHPGVGALDATDWAEADAAAGAPRPSCLFTTGLLANLLGRTAGSTMAVMEVECRSAGDPRCRFLFGSEDALRAVHGAIASGRSADGALAELV